MANRQIEIILRAVDSASGVFRRVGSEFDVLTTKASRAASNGGLFGGTGLDPFKLQLRPEDRSTFELAVRKELADRQRIIRDAMRDAQVKEAADSFTFGPSTEAWEKDQKDRETVRDAMVARQMSITANVNRARAQAARETTGSEEDEIGAGAGLLAELRGISGIGRLAAGGLGFAIVADKLKAATFQAGKLREQLEHGLITSQEYDEQFRGIIPGVGLISDIGAQINEFYSGWKSNQSLIAEEVLRTSQYYQAQKKAIQDSARASEQQARTIAILKNQETVAPLTGFARTSAESLVGQKNAESEAKARGNQRVSDMEKQSKEITDNLAQEFKKRNDIRGGTDYLAADIIAARQEGDLWTKLQKEVQRRSDDQTKINKETQDEMTEISRLGAEQRYIIVTQENQDVVDRFRKVSGEFLKLKDELIANVFKKAGDYGDAQFRAEGVISQARVSYLEAEGRAGNAAAEVEAKRLRIAESYKQRQQELLGVLNDQRITDEQRARIQDQLANLTSQQAIEQKLVTPTPTPHIDQRIAFQNIGLTTGIAQIQREQQERNEVAIGVKTIQRWITERGDGYLRDIATATRSGGVVFVAASK